MSSISRAKNIFIAAASCGSTSSSSISRKVSPKWCQEALKRSTRLAVWWLELGSASTTALGSSSRMRQKIWSRRRDPSVHWMWCAANEAFTTSGQSNTASSAHSASVMSSTTLCTGTNSSSKPSSTLASNSPICASIRLPASGSTATTFSRWGRRCCAARSRSMAISWCPEPMPMSKIVTSSWPPTKRASSWLASGAVSATVGRWRARRLNREICVSWNWRRYRLISSVFSDDSRFDSARAKR
ncbi:MAG TPA: hypothetical protein VF092_12845 [Longimicrobium sp.]